MQGLNFLLSMAALGLMSHEGWAYQLFQAEIPNGGNVPHPCISNSMWSGVGHENPQGSGVRNPFGLDFFNNGKKWNATLCRMDSDLDGRTNGEELGDPDCTWVKGAVPKSTTGNTHPGVCEPLGSTQCAGKNQFVFCETSGGFDCSATQEAAVFTKDVAFPTTSVPDKDTTYICMGFEFPADKDYHVIATEPMIDNTNVMHHIVVYGCPDGVTLDVPLEQTFECPNMDECQEPLAVWTPGIKGDCLQDNMGFLVGKSGIKVAVIQHHWDNPFLLNDQTDSSGYKFYLTPNLRADNAGVFMIGQSNLMIPPNALGHVETGGCYADCMEEIMSSDIFITQALNHMHKLGRAQITEIKRNGSFLQYLAKDDDYDFNAPKLHKFTTPVRVTSKDDLKTSCVFRSIGRDTTTRFGLATTDEMCISFLTYYPKEAFNTPTCFSWKSLSHCEYEKPVVRGCNMTKLGDLSDPYVKEINEGVSSKCGLVECRKECHEFVRRVKAEPCYVGDVSIMLRLYGMYSTPDETSKNAIIKWYTQLDSCDWELFKEGYNQHTGSYDVTAGSTSLGASLITVFMATVLLLF